MMKHTHALLRERRIDPRWIAGVRDYTAAWIEITCLKCGAEFGCPVSSRKGRLARERADAITHAESQHMKAA